MSLLSCHGTNEKGLCISVNGVEYSTLGLSCDTLDLTKLSTETEAEIRIKNYDDYDLITVDGIVMKEGEAFVPVRKIAKNLFLTLITTKGEKSDTLYLRTMHSDLPEMIIDIKDGATLSSGDFYLSYVNICLIQKINNQGEVVLYEYMKQDTTYLGKCAGWWDFKKHVYHDDIIDEDVTLYSYHVPDANHIKDGFSGFNPGMRVIFGSDSFYNADSEIVHIPYKTIQLKEDKKHNVHEGDPIDGHDFYMCDYNHYIVSSYIKQLTSEGKEVYAAYLQEIRNDSLIFTWCSTDFPDMEKWLDPVFQETAGPDYVHFNSIDVLPDGNWLCSFRHISSILKIDRNGTGGILWRLAGADNDGTYSFHGQHYVRYHAKDNTITLFNNGNDTGPTQMIRLNVDMCTGIVSKSTILHDDGYFTQACGALTFSDNNMIVGWGIPGDTINDSNRLLTEYDKSGAAIFSIIRPTNNDTINSILGSYRCVKY